MWDRIIAIGLLNKLVKSIRRTLSDTLHRMFKTPEKIIINHLKYEMTSDELECLIYYFYDYERNEFRSCGYIENRDCFRLMLEKEQVIDYVRCGAEYALNYVVGGGGQCLLSHYALFYLNKQVKRGKIKITNDYIEYSLSRKVRGRIDYIPSKEESELNNYIERATYTISEEAD